MKSTSYERNISVSRSSCPEMFCKKVVLKNFKKFTGKHCPKVSFLIKLQASNNL